MLIAALSLAAAVPAAAADGKSPPDPNKRICQTFPARTGSRLGEQKICKTQAEWDDERLRNKQNIERSQLRGPPVAQ